MLFGLDARPVVVEETVRVAGMIPGIAGVVCHRPYVCGVMVYFVESRQAAQQDHVEPRAGGVETCLGPVGGLAHFGEALVSASGCFLRVFQVSFVARLLVEQDASLYHLSAVVSIFRLVHASVEADIVPVNKVFRIA